MNFYNTYAPCEALQDIVEFYWYSKCELEQSLIQEMFTPTFQALSFNLSGWEEEIVSDSGQIRMDKPCYIIGQPLSKRVSLSNPKGIHILGVKFTALGLYQLTGIDMKHISDKIIDAQEIWNRDIALLYEEILSKETQLEQLAALEHFLMKKRNRQPKNDRIEALNDSLYQIEHHKIFSIAHIRDNNFISKKTFERYFQNYIGVSPKQYANICRFNKLRSYLDHLNTEADWNDISFDFGYYDQSHLIREFKRYAGKTPADYISHHLQKSFSESEFELQSVLS